jgi:transposase-like protein
VHVSSRTYTEEVKAACVAALLTGQSVSSVAAEYSIPRGTVAGWSAQARGQLFQSEKKERIGQLVIEYLITNLETLRAQAAFFANEKWLQRQSAGEVAVLHGVCTDKAIRLLEALAAQSESGGSAEIS